MIRISKAALIMITVIYVLLVFPALAIHRAGETENEDAKKFQAQIEEISRDTMIPGLVFALKEPDAMNLSYGIQTATMSMSLIPVSPALHVIILMELTILL